jgi:hypothetical protein
VVVHVGPPYLLVGVFLLVTQLRRQSNPRERDRGATDRAIGRAGGGRAAVEAATMTLRSCPYSGDI